MNSLFPELDIDSESLLREAGSDIEEAKKATAWKTRSRRQTRRAKSESTLVEILPADIADGNRPPFYGARNQTTMWAVGRETSKDHPTAKPVDLWKPPIDNHTKPGEIMYEPFSGSGSQIIAAEQTGRRCYAMELSPQYVDVAVRRWQAYTGQRAVHAITGEPFPG